jgi:hypothetical protein
MGIIVSLERMLVNPEIRLNKLQEDLRLDSLELAAITQELEVARKYIIYYHQLGGHEFEQNQWAMRFRDLESARAVLQNVCDNEARLVSLGNAVHSMRRATRRLAFITRSAKVLNVSDRAIERDIDRFEKEKDDTEEQLDAAEQGIDEIKSSTDTSRELLNASLVTLVERIVGSPDTPAVALTPAQTPTHTPSVQRVLKQAPVPPHSIPSSGQPPAPPPLLSALLA